MDEILAGSGMSGFVSILDPPEAVPHLQALVDDIKDIPLPAVAEGHWKVRQGRGEAVEGESGTEAGGLSKRPVRGPSYSPSPGSSPSNRL